MSLNKGLLPPNPEFLLQNKAQVNHVSFSTKQLGLLFASNRNGDLNIYDINSRRSIFDANLNKESLLCIAELDNLNFLTQSINGFIYKWFKSDIDWKFECIYHEDVYSFCHFELNPEKAVLYVPSNQSSVIDCIELVSNKKVFSLAPNLNDAKKGMLMNMKSIDSNFLLAGYENGELCSFDLRNLKELNGVNLFNGQPLMCFDYDKNSNFGISGSTDLSMKHFRLENNSDLKLENTFNIVNPGLNTVKIRKLDSKIFATGGWDSRVRVYGVKNQKLLVVLDFHKDAINTIDFSIKTGMMAVGSNDYVISFWNLYSNKLNKN